MVKSPESPAKAGMAGLARKAGPGKVWQAWSRPGFCGNHGHKSMAFLVKQKSMPGFLGLPGQVKNPQIPGIPCHILLLIKLGNFRTIVYVLKHLYIYIFMIITHSYSSRIMQTCSTILQNFRD